jgi:hypothetical protein
VSDCVRLLYRRFTPCGAGYYVILVLILVITVLVSVYHKQIVHWLTPAAEWLHK